MEELKNVGELAALAREKVGAAGAGELFDRS
jgi:hypothetical protein